VMVFDRIAQLVLSFAVLYDVRCPAWGASRRSTGFRAG
jgi:hypothetical protein